jgi:hypothetical protein
MLKIQLFLNCWPKKWGGGIMNLPTTFQSGGMHHSKKSLHWLPQLIYCFCIAIPMPLFIYIYSLCVSVWYHHTCRKNLPSFCGYNVRTLSKSVKGNSPSTLPMVRIFVV